MTTSQERIAEYKKASEKRAELVSRIMKMWNDGHPQWEIAKELGMAESTVRNIVHSELK